MATSLATGSTLLIYPGASQFTFLHSHRPRHYLGGLPALPRACLRRGVYLPGEANTTDNMNSIASKTPQAALKATQWSADKARSLKSARYEQAPIIERDHATPMSPDLDVWDAWPLADVSGRPIPWRGGELWFALTVSRSDDPETRHHLARIHHFHRIGDQFEHIGETLPNEIAPGARQWSGSARYEDGVVTLFFTATGNKGDEELTYHQRIFSSSTQMPADGDFGEWSKPIEVVAADGRIYRPADENIGEPGKIKAFRDPSHFRDERGLDYLLFTASSAAKPGTHDGMVGLAVADEDSGYKVLPPLIEAIGVNNELERPHIVRHGGQLYLFWSTQRGVFAPGIDAPTGLYGATASSLAGPWTFLNGHGLVVGNPVERPTQAYSWWVLPDLTVASFVDYWGPEDHSQSEEATRRSRFGGTFAPFLQIALDGDRAWLVDKE